MKKTTIAAVSAALFALASSAVYAQNVGGAVGGGAAGAAIGGPVGAGVGAIVGSMLPAHPSVRSDRRIVVGEVLPEDYAYYPVPNHEGYDYVIVNNQRVIVDRHHRIVRIIED
jgi:hypothetical protein